MAMIIVSPMSVAAVTTSRGAGAANLLTADPKEVWADSVAGSAASIDIDLGSVQSIDTIFLGYAYDVAPGAIWSISGGTASYTGSVIQAATTLRVPDVAGQAPAMSHALWFGGARAVRYLRITVTQTAGWPPLKIGVLLVGRAFQPILGREWGSGRRPIDTGTATPLAGGGYGIAEGVRKRGFYWTFGDLTADEVEALEAIALDRGETRPLLVVEDAAGTAGLRSRIHYGLFERFRSFERRNKAQTRWELGVEEWV